MNIGVDTRSILAGPSTGVANYVWGLIDGLAELERKQLLPDMYYLCSIGVHNEQLLKDITGRRVPFTYQHRTLSNKVLTFLWQLSRYPSMHRLFPKIDLFVLPNIGMIPHPSSVPYAVVIHDISFVHAPHWYSLKRRAWHRLARFERLVKNATFLVAVSQASADALLERYPELDPNKIAVIRPAMSITSPTASSPAVIDVPKKYLLYIGTIEPRKNIEACIHAYRLLAARYPGLELVLAGQYGWKMRNFLKKAANSAGIRWLEYVTDEEKNYLYQHAAMLLWPSLYEGFGFPPLESLRNGTPVVTSYRTSLPEVLGTTVFYVNPYNAGELAVVIDSLLREADISLFKNVPVPYAERTWEHVAEEFSQAIHAHI